MNWLLRESKSHYGLTVLVLFSGGAHVFWQAQFQINLFVPEMKQVVSYLISWVNFCILLIFNEDIKPRQGVSEGSN